jgi:hypothetical protein
MSACGTECGAGKAWSIVPHEDSGASIIGVIAWQSMTPMNNPFVWGQLA